MVLFFFHKGVPGNCKNHLIFALLFYATAFLGFLTEADDSTTFEGSEFDFFPLLSFEPVVFEMEVHRLSVLAIAFSIKSNFAFCFSFGLHLSYNFGLINVSFILSVLSHL